MAAIARQTSSAGRQDDSERLKKNRPKSGKNSSPKGAMREPTQQAAAVGKQEELKKALQDLEEKKGDWSKGG